MYIITNVLIESFRDYLINEEKSPATIAKYIRDVQALVDWLSTPELDKPTVLTYKMHLMAIYAPTSVNAAISSLNSFFVFCE
jgi:site-specific recombinase XerD